MSTGKNIPLKMLSRSRGSCELGGFDVVSSLKHDQAPQSVNKLTKPSDKPHHKLISYICSLMCLATCLSYLYFPFFSLTLADFCLSSL